LIRLRFPWQLARDGILGINRRNSRYISRYNPRRLFPLVDNKLKTKIIAQQAGINTPSLIGTIAHQHDVRRIGELVADYNGFAIKPAKGSGGKGILVITDKDTQRFYKSSGAAVSPDDIQRHVSNILSGLYSLGGSPDTVIIEELIHFDPSFAHFTVEGVPDIRVIVCRGCPVMAMMRLSTHASDGKANLHQGAVGVGLDIATGKALNAVQNGEVITHHPDTGQLLSELVVPNWSDLLVIAASCYDVTQLGYLGIDIVLDRYKGPMLLELNARPGLGIQVANGAGLRPRLTKIDNLTAAELALGPEERSALSRTWFGA
jgi:alpha-L-glutamate ligase-like protein